MSSPLAADDAAVLGFVDALYERAEEPGGWAGALRGLAHTLSGELVALHRYDARARRGTALEVPFGTSPDVLRRAYTDAAPHNIWMEKLRSGSMPRPGDIIVSHRLYPDAELVKTLYFNEFLDRFGFFASIGAVLETRGRELTSVTVLRGRRAGRYREDEQLFLKRIAPHLRHVHRVEQRFASARDSCAVLEEILDLLPTAVFAVGPDLEIVSANHAAQMLADRGDGLRRSGRRLELSDSTAARELRGLVAGLAATARGERAAVGGAALAGRPSLSPPYAITVIPARPIVPLDRSGAACCLVLVEDPEHREPPPEHRMMSLWNLTAGEARVASLLTTDSPPREIADELGISFNTVRTHLQRIYRKTSTSGQAQLVRLLTRLGLTVRQPAIDDGFATPPEDERPGCGP